MFIRCHCFGIMQLIAYKMYEYDNTSPSCVWTSKKNLATQNDAAYRPKLKYKKKDICMAPRPSCLSFWVIHFSWGSLSYDHFLFVCSFFPFLISCWWNSNICMCLFLLFLFNQLWLTYSIYIYYLYKLLNSTVYSNRNRKMYTARVFVFQWESNPTMKQQM